MSTTLVSMHHRLDALRDADQPELAALAAELLAHTRTQGLTPTEGQAHIAAALTTLMGGLDAVLNPSTNGAEAQLAQRLLDQGHAQGLGITEREAQMAARLLARPPVMPAPGSPFNPDAYFGLPKLARTPDENAARTRSRLNPRRWGPLVAWAAVFLAPLTLNAIHPQALGHLVNGLIGFPLMVLVGGGGGLGCLGYALAGCDDSLYADRQRAAYQASLAPLSTIQLEELKGLLSLEADRNPNRLTNGPLILQNLIDAVIADRARTSVL